MTAVAMTHPDGETQTPIVDVLSVLSGELERVRILGSRVEVAICEIAVQSSIDSRIVSELQHLDAILQHIGALRDYVSELSSRCDVALGVVTASALDRVSLADVRARLSGEDPGDDEDGEWELV